MREVDIVEAMLKKHQPAAGPEPAPIGHDGPFTSST